MRQRSGILRFLIARMIYQDGVNALLALGGVFAAGDVRLVDHRDRHLRHHPQRRRDLRLPGRQPRSTPGSAPRHVVIVSLVMLTVATLGIVSTGPGYTLFGALLLPGADSGGLFGTPAEKAYIVFGLLVGLAFGPVQASSRSYLARSVTRRRGRPLFRHLCAGRPGDEFPRRRSWSPPSPR